LQGRSAEKLRADCGGRLVEAVLRVEHVDECTLTDLEAEKIGQESVEALEGDTLGEAQVRVGNPWTVRIVFLNVAI
jgi:hypothetical protein